MRRALVLQLTLVLAILAPLLASPGAQAAPIPAERLVLAFYYPWFDLNTWTPANVTDYPRSRYTSSDPAAIARQVDQAKAAGIDAFVSAWLGRGNQTEGNLKILLDAARNRGFRASLYFETTSEFLGSQAAIVDSLRHILATHVNHPAFLRHDGKPVIFFWRPAAVPRAGGQSPIQAWQAIREQVDPRRTTIWIGEGDRFEYLQAFDGIHAYSIAWSSNPAGTLASYAGRARQYPGKFWVATAMPGYNDLKTGRSDAFAVDRQGGAYYERTLQGAIASDPEWLVITSWNEWIEGTAIEPAESWGDTYLHITKRYSDQFKSGVAPAPAAPTGRGLDYAIAGGRFFTQANGQGGAGGSGFAVTDDGGIPFWSEFNRLGGLQTIGYPISRRFLWDGFVVQAFQKMVMQWQPGKGMFFVNVMDVLHNNGKDEWLEAARATPRPFDTAADAGLTWNQVAGRHLALLEPNAAIKRRYLAAGDPIIQFGLPMSIQDFGGVVVLRAQRAVFQQWKSDTPWARAGEVTIANGGDLAKEVGIYPGEAIAPEPPR